MLMLLMDSFFAVLTSGHCLQFGALHFWFSALVELGRHNALFLTKEFPIELPFFTANIIRVSPISCLMSS